MLMLLGVPLLGGLQGQYMGENGDFQAQCMKISQTVSITATVNVNRQQDIA